jgi:hypothetical protein
MIPKSLLDKSRKMSIVLTLLSEHEVVFGGLDYPKGDVV